MDNSANDNAVGETLAIAQSNFLGANISVPTTNNPENHAAPMAMNPNTYGSIEYPTLNNAPEINAQEIYNIRLENTENNFIVIASLLPIAKRTSHIYTIPSISLIR